MKQGRISILGAGWLGLPLANYLEEQGYVTQLSTASEARYNALKKQNKRVVQLVVETQAVHGDWNTFSQADVLIINIPPKRSSTAQEQFAALHPLLLKSPIQKVLFVSSTSVYTNTNRIVTEEEGAENKGHILYKSEQAFQKLEGIETTVLRLAGLIGGERHPGRFFQRTGVIQQANTPVNLLHRTDCLQCIHQIILQDYWGHTVNACADSHPLKKDFYPVAAQMLGLTPAEVVEASHPSYKIISNQKIKTALNIQFRESDLLALLNHWY